LPTSRRTFLSRLAAALGAAFLPALPALGANPRAVVHMSPTCGCCGEWLKHLRANGLRGVSMAAHAQVLDSRSEIQRVARLVKKRFPSLAEFSDPERDRGWAFLRLVPRVISVIDYTHGFGHSVLAKL
jgi:hypothetical protein